MIPAWPDVLIVAIVAVFAWRGARSGFVAELAGPLALLLAIAAALAYPGSFDVVTEHFLHLGSGSAHAVSLIVFAVAVYAAVLFVANTLGRVAKLPGLALINGVAGLLAGATKTIVGLWAVLYVVLFFPLPPDLRVDLARSLMVHALTQGDAAVDDAARTHLPPWTAPLLEGFFDRHHT